jgi:uncharacterized membrane protein YphA (DoxX/SURF4 family)
MDYTILQAGLGGGEIALTINRLALGAFFGISGYHKLFNSQRHATFTQTLRDCKVPCIPVMQWFVPSVEFFGGLALLSGILAPFASLGLMAICLVAICTDGLGRIPAYRPIDKADWLDDLLYLPEVLYLFGLVIVLTMGPGLLTVPDLLF